MPSCEAITGVSQVVYRLWMSLDSREFDRLRECLDDDAKWMREGRWQVGHSAIFAALARRPDDLFIRHMVTNMVVDGGPVQFDCRYYITAYATRHDRVEEHHVAEAPVAITEVSTSCRRTGDGYRVTAVNPEIAFLRPIPGGG